MKEEIVQDLKKNSKTQKEGNSFFTSSKVNKELTKGQYSQSKNNNEDNKLSEKKTCSTIQSYERLHECISGLGLWSYYIVM